MTTRTFAAWVKPFADHFRRQRAEVVEFARSVPEERWSTPSPLPGWTCKDLLAHIGKANDQLFQQLLRTVIAGRPVDTKMFIEVDTDGSNERGVEERRALPVAAVIAEVEAAGELVQELLSQLTDEHERLRQDEPLFDLKGFLQGARKESHDIEHLTQIKAALGQ